MSHARFGVTHSCRWIAFDRAEIPLAIDQPFAHRPRLRHVNERGVNHGFAVRVIISAGVTANFCALPVLPPWEKRQIVHRVENSSLRWLESVARVWQRARNDDGHRVIEERSRHFLRHVYRLDFFVWVDHDCFSQRRASKRRDALPETALPTCAKFHPTAGLSQADQRERRAAVKSSKSRGRCGWFAHNPGIALHIELERPQCRAAEKNPARFSPVALLLEEIARSTPHQIAALG